MREYACTVEIKKAGVAIAAHYVTVTDSDGDAYVEMSDLIVNGVSSMGRPELLGRLLDEMAQLELNELHFKRDYQ